MNTIFTIFFLPIILDLNSKDKDSINYFSTFPLLLFLVCGWSRWRLPVPLHGIHVIKISVRPAWMGSYVYSVDKQNPPETSINQQIDGRW